MKLTSTILLLLHVVYFTMFATPAFSGGYGELKGIYWKAECRGELKSSKQKVVIKYSLAEFQGGTYRLQIELLDFVTNKTIYQDGSTSLNIGEIMEPYHIQVDTEVTLKIQKDGKKQINLFLKDSRTIPDPKDDVSFSADNLDCRLIPIKDLNLN